MKFRKPQPFFFRKLIAVAALALMVIVILLYLNDLRDFLVDDTRYAAEIAAAAARYEVDPKLVRAVVFVESKFNPNAIGKAGEVGLMQLLPGGAVTDWARARERAVPGRRELQDVKLNLDIGCYYLSRGLRRYPASPRQTELALCFYNAGASRADRWDKAAGERELTPHIGIESTRNYVEKVMKRYYLYSQMEKQP